MTIDSLVVANQEPPDALTAERVVLYIEQLIQSGQLKPGDRLPAERVNLARMAQASEEAALPRPDPTDQGDGGHDK